MFNFCMRIPAILTEVNNFIKIFWSLEKQVFILLPMIVFYSLILKFSNVQILSLKFENVIVWSGEIS